MSSTLPATVTVPSSAGARSPRSPRAAPALARPTTLTIVAAGRSGAVAASISGWRCVHAASSRVNTLILAIDAAEPPAASTTSTTEAHASPTWLARSAAVDTCPLTYSTPSTATPWLNPYRRASNAPSGWMLRLPGTCCAAIPSFYTAAAARGDPSRRIVAFVRRASFRSGRSSRSGRSTRPAWVGGER